MMRGNNGDITAKGCSPKAKDVSGKRAEKKKRRKKKRKKMQSKEVKHKYNTAAPGSWTGRQVGLV